MCTAIAHRAGGGFLARNLDLQVVHGQQVVIAPRRVPLRFRHQPCAVSHYAMIGAALPAEELPLYFEAVNEAGLAAAALAFEGDCVYAPSRGEAGELAPFEVIPYVLCHCATVEEVRARLRGMRVSAIPFDAAHPLTPLHWMVSDRERTLVIEPLGDGLCVLDDPVEVLSNSPRLSYQLTHLAEFAGLTPEAPTHLLGLQPSHRGFGLKGLPGDFTPSSRFVRAAFLKAMLPTDRDRMGALLDTFRVLDSVAYLHGAMPTADGAYAVTQYSCACHLPSGTYYYRSYDDPTVRAVSLRHISPEGAVCKVYPMTAAFRVTEEN